MPGSPNRLVWAPRASQDLREIWHHCAEQASAETADKILEQVIHAAARVGERPLTGRSRDRLKMGLRSALAHPYLVFYRVRQNDVQVVRVLHERRNLAAILAEEIQQADAKDRDPGLATGVSRRTGRCRVSTPTVVPLYML